MANTRTALLSVSDKTGLDAFASALKDLGFHFLSSGGTAKALADKGIPVETVEAYTESPEVMDGRVKTLHPRVHAGILYRGAEDDADLARLKARPIELVIVNLYPFEQTVARPGATDAEIIENIDVGGPSMVRAAAKNHGRVAVVCEPSDYSLVIDELKAHGAIRPETRRALALKAFAHTAKYDAAITNYFAREASENQMLMPKYFVSVLERAYPLRYGENPHQQGAFYGESRPAPGSLAACESLGSGAKELSFNNLVDAEAALDAVREFEEPAAVVVKHTNPCGVATAQGIREAYRTARDADSLSAFGGIVALNRPVDDDTAVLLAETFLECVIAPSFLEGALQLLRAKKNLRLLATGAWLPANADGLVAKSVSGGMVVQSRDNTAGGEVRGGKIVSKRAPSAEELTSLDFAWRVSKHVKSNAIVLAKGNVTVGVGAGQMSRVVSVQIACEKAKDQVKGSVLASDAFFPFADGVEAAAKAGVSAIVQPGGSVKDAEVIAMADSHGLAMVFTGVRHFRH